MGISNRALCRRGPLVTEPRALFSFHWPQSRRSPGGFRCARTAPVVPSPRMRAARIHRYGPPEVLQVDDVPPPEPGPRDLLVQVRASSVNPVDVKIRSGGQRALIHYRLPWTLGLDFSGEVVAVGRDVTRFRVGDEVYGSPTHRRPGCYAEQLAVDERVAA
ncbi:MAG TPA: hypothetical protein DEF51_30115, partial [Myxococcales bacterium]|nr:hypothetical protein [Myxococcales bacterium]